MSRRQVHLEEVIMGPGQSRKAVVHYDSDLQEYSTVFYVNGDKLAGATYYTDDKQDAIDTGTCHVAGTL